jgi:hypothetical protein
LESSPITKFLIISAYRFGRRPEHLLRCLIRSSLSESQPGFSDLFLIKLASPLGLFHANNEKRTQTHPFLFCC